MRVMIVDDSKTMRLLVKRALRQAGVEVEDVVEAEDGLDALGRLGQEKPDLVLCDWNMPRMSGLQLLTEIRAQGLAIDFGFVTSQATETMWEEARDAGARFLIAKPIDPEAIKKALAGLEAGARVLADGWNAAPAGGPFHLPSDHELASMWGQLLNRPVRVLKDVRSTISDRDAAAIAVYQTRGGGICGAALADLALCASAGAVLSLLPPQSVANALRARRLEEAAWGNLCEVFNVSSRFFHGASDDFVHLEGVFRGGTELPREHRRFLRTAEKKASYGVDIAGYGKGTMGLFGW